MCTVRVAPGPSCYLESTSHPVCGRNTAAAAAVRFPFEFDFTSRLPRQARDKHRTKGNCNERAAVFRTVNSAFPLTVIPAHRKQIQRRCFLLVWPVLSLPWQNYHGVAIAECFTPKKCFHQIRFSRVRTSRGCVGAQVEQPHTGLPRRHRHI